MSEFDSMYARLDKEREKNSGSVVVLNDDSNVATIPGFPYEFEATGEQLLVAVDIFRSGYECKECGGSGREIYKCECELEGHPGKKYAPPTSGGILSSRDLMLCPSCQGNYEGVRKDNPCPACKGKGHVIFIPETSKTLPTTGVIVSVGNLVKNKEQYKTGKRVLFGAFSGTMIPTKATGVCFKFLREHEILGLIYKGEDLGAFDFVIPEDAA